MYDRSDNPSGAVLAQFGTDALEVVSNPEKYHNRATLRRLAWISLMNQRGCRVDQLRLSRMTSDGDAA